MPTNVVRVGPATSYGSGWEDVGDDIQQGLRGILGYYQEYQRQKRFEMDSQRESRERAARMAADAEDREMRKKINESTLSRLQVENLQSVAALTPADQVPAEFMADTTAPKMATEIGIADAGPEVGGPLASQIQVGEKLTKTPMRTKKVGDYTAVLDWGGEQAKKAKEAAEQADWLTLQEDVDLGTLGKFKAGQKLPPALAGLTQKAAPKPDTQMIGETLYERQPDGKWTVAVVGKKTTTGAEGGSYKAVYDKTVKEDVMANDAMIAKEPGRYGPAKKSEGGGKPILGGELTKVTELRQGLQAIKGLRGEISEQDSTGLMARFAAWVPGVTNLTGWGTDAKARQATIDLVKQIIGKGLEGGVLRKEDEVKYKKILPTMGDRTEVAIAKVNQLETILKDNEQILLENLEAGGRDVSALIGLGAKPASTRTDPLGLGL
jgi:hypothetical protein